ncbi:MAG: hypothetical protein C0597_09365 [Marinilabiliales bacterium]|nr:MAG: hypothetical protein C0597_09365 [Marinilabiliales bacterium]
MTKFYIFMRPLLLGFFFLLINHVGLYSQCNVQINGLESEYCISGNIVHLEGYPMGGTFTGSGVWNPGPGNFDFIPGVAGEGTHEIKYVFDT